jgi:hypothetical protein
VQTRRRCPPGSVASPHPAVDLLIDVLDGIVTTLSKSETIGSNDVTIRPYHANRDTSGPRSSRGRGSFDQAIGNSYEIVRGLAWRANSRTRISDYNALADAKHMGIPAKTCRESVLVIKSSRTARTTQASTRRQANLARKSDGEQGYDIAGFTPGQALPPGRFYPRRHTRYQPKADAGDRSVWKAIGETCLGGHQ